MDHLTYINTVEKTFLSFMSYNHILMVYNTTQGMQNTALKDNVVLVNESLRMNERTYKCCIVSVYSNTEMLCISNANYSGHVSNMLYSGNLSND